MRYSAFHETPVSRISRAPIESWPSNITRIKIQAIIRLRNNSRRRQKPIVFSAILKSGGCMIHMATKGRRLADSADLIRRSSPVLKTSSGTFLASAIFSAKGGDGEHNAARIFGLIWKSLSNRRRWGRKPKSRCRGRKLAVSVEEPARPAAIEPTARHAMDEVKFDFSRDFSQLAAHVPHAAAKDVS